MLKRIIVVLTIMLYVTVSVYAQKSTYLYFRFDDNTSYPNYNPDHLCVELNNEQLIEIGSGEICKLSVSPGSLLLKFRRLRRFSIEKYENTPYYYSVNNGIVSSSHFVSAAKALNDKRWVVYSPSITKQVFLEPGDSYYIHLKVKGIRMKAKLEYEVEDGSDPQYKSAFIIDPKMFANNSISLDVGEQYETDNVEYETELDALTENVDFDSEEESVVKGRQSISSRSEKALAKSDVDVGIPTSDINNDNTFAVIIANENYKREVAVEYAANDGAIFREYCIKTLGIPDKNVRMVADASYLDMKAEIEWISKVAESYKGDARLLFYYAGHGIPDESSKDAYLLPVDGMGSNPSTGYKLSDLYASLGKFPTKSTVVFLDACFSGAQRSGDMMASARGVAIKAKTATPVGNMVVLSAATGDETAYPYKEKGHGMFTYFLLKKLQQTNGKATLEEIATYVTDEVGKRSIVENAKSQTPTVVSAPEMENVWRTVQLYGAWNEQMPEDF